jgi:lysophospholipase L1-like esterase
MNQKLRNVLLLVILALCSFCKQDNSIEPTPEEVIEPTLDENPEPKKAKKVFLIGDSTCSDYKDSYYPRTGWGTKFKGLIDSVEVENDAISGRSSKSFYNDEYAWPKTVAKIEEGDYLFIQFGHNDQKTDTTKATSPFTTYQSYLLKFINETRNKNAYPVLVTSINRNWWDNDRVLTNSLGDYPRAMKELAIQENVPLIDLNYLTKVKFESLGKSYTTDSIFLNLQAGQYDNYPTGIEDNSHLQEKGAELIAKMVLEELEKLKESSTVIKSLFD